MNRMLRFLENTKKNYDLTFLVSHLLLLDQKQTSEFALKIQKKLAHQLFCMTILTRKLCCHTKTNVSNLMNFLRQSRSFFFQKEVLRTYEANMLIRKTRLYII